MISFGKRIPVGAVVHVDTDNPEWGRVVSEGEVIEKTRERLLVRLFSIRATIWVDKADASLTSVS